jgi:hypothetical protein
MSTRPIHLLHEGRGVQRLAASYTSILDKCKRFAHPLKAMMVERWLAEVMTNAPGFIEEDLPAFGETLSERALRHRGHF